VLLLAVGVPAGALLAIAASDRIQDLLINS